MTAIVCALTDLLEEERTKEGENEGQGSDK